MLKVSAFNLEKTKKFYSYKKIQAVVNIKQKTLFIDPIFSEGFGHLLVAATQMMMILQSWPKPCMLEAI